MAAAAAGGGGGGTNRALPPAAGLQVGQRARAAGWLRSYYSGSLARQPEALFPLLALQRQHEEGVAPPSLKLISTHRYTASA